MHAEQSGVSFAFDEHGQKVVEATTKPFVQMRSCSWKMPRHCSLSYRVTISRIAAGAGSESRVVRQAGDHGISEGGGTGAEDGGSGDDDDRADKLDMQQTRVVTANFVFKLRLTMLLSTAPTPAPPTPSPTQHPTQSPTPRPTPSPSPRPTPSPSPVPTPRPTVGPTHAPTPAPTAAPTRTPTAAPTPLPQCYEGPLRGTLAGGCPQPNPSMCQTYMSETEARAACGLLPRCGGYVRRMALHAKLDEVASEWILATGADDAPGAPAQFVAAAAQNSTAAAWVRTRCSHARTHLLQDPSMVQRFDGRQERLVRLVPEKSLGNGRPHAFPPHLTKAQQTNPLTFSGQGGLSFSLTGWVQMAGVSSTKSPHRGGGTIVAMAPAVGPWSVGAKALYVRGAADNDALPTASLAQRQDAAVEQAPGRVEFAVAVDLRQGSAISAAKPPSAARQRVLRRAAAY